MKIYNAERREFSIHISVKKFWSENFGQQSEGGKTPDDPDGHLQPDHWFKFVIDFRFRLSCHWRFIDGVVNTFSNAHYSQTPHLNWTKPTQGASGNVRVSFGNNLGSPKKIELFIKATFTSCPCLIRDFSPPGTVVYHVTMCSITTPSAYWPVCHGKRRKCNGMLSLHGKLFAFTYTPGASRSASRCFHRLGAFRCAPQEVPSRGRGQLRWLFLFNRLDSFTK